MFFIDHKIIWKFLKMFHKQKLGKAFYKKHVVVLPFPLPYDG